MGEPPVHEIPFADGEALDLSVTRVMGILNVTPDSDLMATFLQDSGLTDVMAGSLEPSYVSEPYYRLPYDDAPRMRLDYVLHRNAGDPQAEYVFRERQELSSGNVVTLSDHFGVLVAFG